MNINQRFIFTLAILLSAFTASAQTERLRLDSLTIYTRNIQDVSELIPMPETDTSYKEPNVELTIQFNVIGIDNLESVELIFEKERQKRDFKIFKLQYAQKSTGNFLVIKNKSFPVVNGKVSITETVPAAFLRKKIFLTIQASGKNKVQSNIISKEFN